jgi:membrane-associated phospholipid phosphatase
MPATPYTSPSSDRRADGGLAWRLALAALAAAVVAIPFALALLLVEGRSEALERLDMGTAQRVHGWALESGALVTAGEVVEVVLDPWVFRAVVLGVAVWLWRRGARRLAVWAVATMAIGGVLNVVLKLVVERARPTFEDPVAASGGYSFPSGHATGSMLGAAVLLLVLLPRLAATGRRTAWAAAVVAVLLAGLDRIVLGVHYVSDVLAGWSLALAVVAATSIAFETWRRDTGVREQAPLDAAQGLPQDPSYGEPR